MQTYKKEDVTVNFFNTCSSTDTSKRNRSSAIPRSLTELCGNEDIWKILHSEFTWILKACGSRLKEEIVQGSPLNVRGIYNIGKIQSVHKVRNYFVDNGGFFLINVALSYRYLLFIAKLCIKK